jgi:hypothetical protein
MEHQRLFGKPKCFFWTSQISLNSVASTTKLFNSLSRLLKAERIATADDEIGTCSCQNRCNLGTETP